MLRSKHGDFEKAMNPTKAYKIEGNKRHATKTKK
jgi:hypothetical protein